MAAKSGGFDPPDIDSPLYKKVDACLSSDAKILFSQCISLKNLTVGLQNSLPSLQREIESIQTGANPDDVNLISFTQQILQNIHFLVSKKLTFSNSDRGPFIVVIENEKIGRLHPMNIGKLLQEAQAQNVINISRRGPNRIAVELDSQISANKFLSNPVMLRKGYRLYIPQRLLSCKGIIRDVGDSISEDDLMSDASAFLGRNKVKIVEVRRLNRKVMISDTLSRVPSNSYAVTFEGRILPRFLYVFNSISEIQPFINPVNFCDNCARFGHHKTVCKAKARCPRCKEGHSLDVCPSTINVCISCDKEGHISNNRCCEEFARQRKINEIMAMEGLAFLDAAKKVPRINGYATHAPYHPQPQHFPTLPSTSGPPFSQFRPQESPSLSKSRRNMPDIGEVGHISSSHQSQPVKKKRILESQGYDREGHDSLLFGSQLPSSFGNGTLLTQLSSDIPNQDNSYPSSVQQELASLKSLVHSGQKFSDNDLLKIKSFLLNLHLPLNYNHNEDSSMEYS